MNMQLKPQDIVIALKMITTGDTRWTYVQFSYELYISASEINAGVKRLAQSNLVIINLEGSNSQPTVVRNALIEFLIHGVKYAFPPVRGELTRGMPTAWIRPWSGSTISRNLFTMVSTTILGEIPRPNW